VYAKIRISKIVCINIISYLNTVDRFVLYCF